MAGNKKTYTSRTMMKLLKKNGYSLVRCKGDHFVFKRNNQTAVVTKDLNEMVALRLIKEHDLTED